MKMEKKGRKTFIMFLLAFLIGFFVVSIVEVLRSSFAPSAPGPDVQVASAVSPGEVSRAPLSFADLAEKLKPSVVNISTTKTIRGGGLRSPFGQGSPHRCGDPTYDNAHPGLCGWGGHLSSGQRVPVSTIPGSGIPGRSCACSSSSGR